MLHKPKAGEILIFPSSLFHRTIPVTSNKERCIISFDLFPCPAGTSHKREFEEDENKLKTLYEIGEFEKLLLNVSNLKEKYPDRVEILNLVGAVSLSLLGIFRRPKKITKTAIIREPENAVYYLNIGLVSEHIKPYIHAILDFTRASILQPQVRQARILI